MNGDEENKIDAAIERIAVLEKAYDELEAQTKAQLLVLKEQIRSIAKAELRALYGDEQKYLGSVLYWHHKKWVAVRTVGDGIGLSEHSVYTWVYAAEYKKKCVTCGAEFGEPMSSRGQMGASWHSWRTQCPSCKQKADEVSQRKLTAWQEERARNIEALRTMPYSEYLQTDHWREVRRRAQKRAGFRCEICNNPEGIQVHHRTYERRGEERNDDLIVLCENCHRTFHENGKLVRDYGGAS